MHTSQIAEPLTRTGRNAPRSVPACVSCYVSKLGCDRKTPCARCIQRGKADTCSPRIPPQRKPRRSKAELLAVKKPKTATSTTSSKQAVGLAEAASLELALSSTMSSTPRLAVSSPTDRHCDTVSGGGRSWMPLGRVAATTPTIVVVEPNPDVTVATSTYVAAPGPHVAAHKQQQLPYSHSSQCHTQSARRSHEIVVSQSNPDTAMMYAQQLPLGPNGTVMYRCSEVAVHSGVSHAGPGPRPAMSMPGQHVLFHTSHAATATTSSAVDTATTAITTVTASTKSCTTAAATTTTNTQAGNGGPQSQENKANTSDSIPFSFVQSVNPTAFSTMDQVLNTHSATLGKRGTVMAQQLTQRTESDSSLRPPPAQAAMLHQFATGVYHQCKGVANRDEHESTVLGYARSLVAANNITRHVAECATKLLPQASQSHKNQNTVPGHLQVLKGVAIAVATKAYNDTQVSVHRDNNGDCARSHDGMHCRIQQQRAQRRERFKLEKMQLQHVPFGVIVYQFRHDPLLPTIWINDNLRDMLQYSLQECPNNEVSVQQILSRWSHPRMLTCVPSHFAFSIAHRRLVGTQFRILTLKDGSYIAGMHSSRQEITVDGKPLWTTSYFAPLPKQPHDIDAWANLYVVASPEEVVQRPMNKSGNSVWEPPSSKWPGPLAAVLKSHSTNDSTAAAAAADVDV
jgi:hypothetical protein